MALLASTPGCDAARADPRTGDPAGPALLEAAIAAHGGEAALARLEDLQVTAHGIVRDDEDPERRIVRRIDLRAPSNFAMSTSHGGRPPFTIGLSGDRCWKRLGPFTLACDEEDVADHRRVLEILNARLLHQLDRAAVDDAGRRTVGGIDAPALRIGDLRLTFDPRTHLLIQIDYEHAEPRVESFSEFTEVAGARVATEHTLTISGVLDMTERWVEIVPGGADPARLAPSAPTRAGDIFDGEDPARSIAWVELEALPNAPTSDVDRLAHARRALTDFVSGRGLQPSASDGLLLIWPTTGRARVALTLEEDRPVEAVDEPPFHIETRPAGRFVGIFHLGGDERSPLNALSAVIAQRGTQPVPGAPYELLLLPGADEQPPHERFGLFRIEVVPSPTAGSARSATAGPDSG